MSLTQESRACDWSTKREVKIRRLNTSINLHRDTALFTALYLHLLRNGTDEFQTSHLYENPLQAPANSNYILTLIQCVLAFNIIYTETWSFLFSVLYISIPGLTLLGFLSPSLTWTCAGVAGARLATSRASDDECACMGEGLKIFSHNALV